MRFYPPGIIRYFYRYLITGLFSLFPVYVSTVMAFNQKLVTHSDRPIAIILGVVLLVLGCTALHFAFWDKFFSILIVTESKIILKCPFRKTKIIEMTSLAEIGAFVANADKGLPVEQIYFSDISHSVRNLEKKGFNRSTSHLIMYWYSEQLYQYLMLNFSSRYTGKLCAYHFRRKMKQ